VTIIYNNTWTGHCLLWILQCKSQCMSASSVAELSWLVGVKVSKFDPVYGCFFGLRTMCGNRPTNPFEGDVVSCNRFAVLGDNASTSSWS
jgi:hypothetical protein